jgi:hypothetical protein
VIDPSTGGGAGRRTDRFSDGIDALQIPGASSGRRPPVLFIQENAVAVAYFIGGGAGRACMNDLVVKSQAIDIIGLTLSLIRGQNVIEASRRHVKIEI